MLRPQRVDVCPLRRKGLFYTDRSVAEPMPPDIASVTPNVS
jgi:hypothetical protein